MDETAAVRIEHDSLGPVAVPEEALWGAQTQRAIANFTLGGGPVPAEVVHALAEVKAAAAFANVAVGVLTPEVGAAIAAAAAAVRDGHHDEQFPLDVLQTGSGTSTNMNVNEVIATLAARRLGRRVHPNDEVNASQSSNDTFPTAIHLAAATGVRDDLLPSLRGLEESLRRKAVEFDDVVTVGRTHLRDAVPVTIGQEFASYAAQVRHGRARLESVLPRLLEVPLGGSAAGTGLNVPPGFVTAALARLRDDTGLPLVEAADHLEAQGARDALLELSGQLRTVAVSLHKVVTDLRWKSSGPHTGLAELTLPELQPGSSIMPGKVNPVVPEAVDQAVAQVVGNDAAVVFAAASGGTFELHVAMPVIARNVMESLRLLAASCRLLSERCVDGITVDADRCRAYAAASSATVTALNRHLGYDEAAAVVKQALAEGRPVRDIVVARGHLESGRLTGEQLDAALDLLAMARPHRSGPPRTGA